MNTIDIDSLNLPIYAKDLKLNLSSLLRNEELTPAQRDGTFLTAGYVTRDTNIIRWVTENIAQHADPGVVEAAKAAAAIMGMNNVYYRFSHLVSDETFRKIPAGLRMSVIGKPGVAKADFELYALTASAMNGCGMCMDAHTTILQKHGLTTGQIATAIRIGATLQGIAQTTTIEVATAKQALPA